MGCFLLITGTLKGSWIMHRQSNSPEIKSGPDSAGQQFPGMGA